VRIIDFKSDAAPPLSDHDVAPGYLAQLGAYAAALGQVYHQHAIRPAILWTAEARLMEIAPDRAEDCYRGALASLSGGS
jgi:ATP-dependent helicase/nuclease subunit A